LTILGTHKRKFVFSCSGVILQKAVNSFAKQFIKVAGMNPARPGRIDPYPFNGGGGAGYTGFFPLMESYLMIDVYTDINETEVLLSTCKPDRINIDALRNYLACQIGPVKEVGTI
jgi:hypothetical protein